jgi:hypothetical protein
MEFKMRRRFDHMCLPMYRLNCPPSPPPVFQNPPPHLGLGDRKKIEPSRNFNEIRHAGSCALARLTPAVSSISLSNPLEACSRCWHAKEQPAAVMAERASTLNPAADAQAQLGTTSYDGPYGTVVTQNRPPHRQFPQQAWGLQTVRFPRLHPASVLAAVHSTFIL